MFGQEKTLADWMRRLYGSAVVWTSVCNFLRVASGLLVLPLLMRLLPKNDFGMYYVFLTLASVVPMLDFGFSPAIGRFVNYAMGGAVRLLPQGIADAEKMNGPNRALLWELLRTAQIFYRLLILGTAVVLGGLGTIMVGIKAGETSSPAHTWTAWGVCIAAILAETHFNRWNMFLTNLNGVTAASRITALAYILRLFLACGLLLGGAELLALPSATLAISLVVQWFTRRKCLEILGPCPNPGRLEWKQHFRAIWPNSWRHGLHICVYYLAQIGSMFLCTVFLGLSASADYGLSLQVLGIIQALAGVWTQVKWPLAGQYLARRDYDALRQMMRPRIRLHVCSFAVLSAAAVLLGPALLGWISHDKQMLPPLWLSLLLLNGLLDNHYWIWASFIVLENRFPMVWFTVPTCLSGLALNMILIKTTGLGFGGLILGPLIAGCLCNYWYWPMAGARNIRTTWAGLLFGHKSD